MGELADRIGISQYREKEAITAIRAIREILERDLPYLDKCQQIHDTLKEYDLNLA